MDEQNQKDAYEKALAGLEAQKKVVDNGIAAMRALLGMDALHEGSVADVKSPVAPHAAHHAELRSDTFFNLGIADAAKKYLGIVKAPKSTPDIARALEKGGLKNNSKDFAAFVKIVNTLIKRRAKKNLDFVKVTRGQWGLISWYEHKGTK